MAWSDAYVGLEAEDIGPRPCWDLVRRVYADRLAIVLPAYAEAVPSLAERAEIAALLAGEALRAPWIAVPPGAERAFDVVRFRRGGLECHVGIVVEPGRMLHATTGASACLDRYRDGRWAPRLSGFYRHERLA